MPKHRHVGILHAMKGAPAPTDCLKGIGLDAIAGWAYTNDKVGGQATAQPAIAIDWIRDLDAAHHRASSTLCRLA